MKPLLAIVLVASTLGLGGAGAASASAVEHTSATKYANCAALNEHYPHGVGRTGARDHVAKNAKPVTNFTRNNSVYKANTKSDRDKDGIACEKH